jgi:hypothetical protein
MTECTRIYIQVDLYLHISDGHVPEINAYNAVEVCIILSLATVFAVRTTSLIPSRGTRVLEIKTGINRGTIRDLEGRKGQRNIVCMVEILNSYARLNHVQILQRKYVIMYSWKLNCEQVQSIASSKSAQNPAKSFET